MRHSLLSAVLSLSVLLSTLVAAQDASYTFTTIDVLDALHTLAEGINDSGQIVGSFSDGTKGRGFVTDGDTFTPIDVPGSRTTSAHKINDSGQVVGFFNDDATGRSHGFVTDGVTCRCARTSRAIPENSANFCARFVTLTRDAYLRTAAGCLRTAPAAHAW